MTEGIGEEKAKAGARKTKIINSKPSMISITQVKSEMMSPLDSYNDD